MSAQERRWLRIGMLTDLVARSKTKLGRTALMKLAYLLQTVKGVPLGYNFRLYTYGPFDEDVLNDLGQAEAMQAIVSTMIPFKGGAGYGYEFAEGPSADLVRGLLEDKISTYEDKLNWVIDTFGTLSAADLELLSTIVYADRDCVGRTQPVSADELARQVLEIKPRFSVDYVKQNIHQLQEIKLLQALQS
jgi:hypothetical protein